MFDVITLYANVPLKEINDIIISLIFHNELFTTLTLHEPLGIYRIYMHETHFIFNGDIFDHTGVVMECSFATIVTKQFIVFHK